MKKLVIATVFGLAVLTIFFVVVSRYNVIKSDKRAPIINNKAPFLNESADRIVYTTDTSLRRDPFERDCLNRRGVFNPCGRSCSSADQICVEVCAYTCELRQVNAINLADQCASEPKFDDYPASPIYKGKLAVVDFSSPPEASQFRTVIRAAAAKGPNFAGHYAVAEWGCGTSCQDHAIVDVQTGKIVNFGLPSYYGLDYHVNSSLLVVNPSANLPADSEQVITTEFYVFNENNKLNFSCRLPGASPQILL